VDDLFKVVDCCFGRSSISHAGLFLSHQAFYPRPNLFMSQYFALFYFNQALLHLSDKSPVVVQEPLDCLACQSLRVAVLLRGKVS
jgi:hypothetical protein